MTLHGQSERSDDRQNDPAKDAVRDESVHIARCPEHGLHGERQECFICGGPVDQIAMVPEEDIQGLREENLRLWEVVEELEARLARVRSAVVAGANAIEPRNVFGRVLGLVEGERR